MVFFVCFSKQERTFFFLVLLSYLWRLLSPVRSSWWWLFLTSKGSLTFAAGDGANRKATANIEKKKQHVELNSKGSHRCQQPAEFVFLYQDHIYSKYGTNLFCSGFHSEILYGHGKVAEATEKQQINKLDSLVSQRETNCAFLSFANCI